MGSNVSTVNERKTPKYTSGEIAVSQAGPHAYHRSEAHRWTAMPPAKSEETVANPKLSSNHKKSYDNTQANVIEITRPPTVLDHSVKINKVISFHSSRCWRDYFQASKKSDKLIVIFFSAPRCGFCLHMNPVLDELAAQYTDVEIHKIDVDELFDISREFGVHSMPTFLFIKRGNVVDKVIGTRHEDIQRKIEKHRA